MTGVHGHHCSPQLVSKLWVMIYLSQTQNELQTLLTGRLAMLFY
uniref:Uncharacterized protein n=1 Tax=Zea mays TaxID=4577 RepID=C4J2N6_MAIZE|nr:unknown [Zea mays]